MFKALPFFPYKTKLILYWFCLLYSMYSNAQCAMCRAVLESEKEGIKAEAVNDGILYLMAIPYLLVIAVGYSIYRIKKRSNS